MELVTANKTTRFYTLAIASKGYYFIFFSWIFNPSGLKYLPRSHSVTWHLVGLLWTSDGPDAETSIWRHPALVTHRYPRPRRDSNSQSQQRKNADARCSFISCLFHITQSSTPWSSIYDDLTVTYRHSYECSLQLHILRKVQFSSDYVCKVPPSLQCFGLKATIFLCVTYRSRSFLV